MGRREEGRQAGWVAGKKRRGGALDTKAGGQKSWQGEAGARPTLQNDGTTKRTLLAPIHGQTSLRRFSLPSLPPSFHLDLNSHLIESTPIGMRDEAWRGVRWCSQIGRAHV